MRENNDKHGNADCGTNVAVMGLIAKIRWAQAQRRHLRGAGAADGVWDAQGGDQRRAAACYIHANCNQ